LSAPFAGMKALLTPRYEVGECFQLPVIGTNRVQEFGLLADVAPRGGVAVLDVWEAVERLGGALPEPALRTLTVGNSSNVGYLLAGSGGNRAAVSYSLGQPRFLPRAGAGREPGHGE
jgi:hypothetical protein